MIDQWLYTHVGLTGEPETLADVLRREGPALLRAGLGIEIAAEALETAFPVEVLVGEGTLRANVIIEVATGPVEIRGGRLAMPVRWSPEAEGSFSTFTGVIELERQDRGGALLAVFGRYGFGDGELPAEAVVTATRATARRLLRALAMEIGRVVPPAAAGEALPPRAAVLRVGDVMTPDPVTVREDTPVVVATLVLLREQIGGVPVVDARGAPVGVLTESDLLAREAAPRVRGGPAARQEMSKRLAVTAGDACTRPALTVPQQASVKEAARTLLDRDVSRLIVIDDGEMVGMLSRHDVLKALARTPAELQASIDACLEDAGVSGVHAEVVAGGAVRLTGEVRNRTQVATAEHAVRALDGVTDVVTTVSWQHDSQVAGTG